MSDSEQMLASNTNRSRKSTIPMVAKRLSQLTTVSIKYSPMSWYRRTETFTYMKPLLSIWRSAATRPRYRYVRLIGLPLSLTYWSAFGNGDHSTTFSYNDRGQVTRTTLPTDPQPSATPSRPQLVYTYNDSGNNNGSNNNNIGDATLVSVTDALQHVTTYTYDDYRRLKSVTPPDRTSRTQHFSTMTRVERMTIVLGFVHCRGLPGKKAKTVYDDNRRKWTVTVGYGTSMARRQPTLRQCRQPHIRK